MHIDKTLVLVGVAGGCKDMGISKNSHLATLEVHHKLVKYNTGQNILNFSFSYNNDTDIYGNISEQCEQLKCNFNHNKVYIIGITCNTMHLYFDYYRQCMLLPNVILLNVIDITTNYLCKKRFMKIGLLSTEKTRDTDLFAKPLTKCGIDIIGLGKEDGSQLETIIYKIKQNRHRDLDREKIISYINRYKQNGAKAIILGCSELPLIIREKSINGVKIINPMALMAKLMVKL